MNIISGRYQRDPHTGDMWNVAATFTTGLKYHFVKFAAKAEDSSSADEAAPQEKVRNS